MAMGDTKFKFNPIPAKSLDMKDANIYRSDTRTLNVTCEAPIRFALKGVDNYSGYVKSGSMQDSYGLSTRDKQAVGTHYLFIDPTRTTVNNKAAVLLQSAVGAAAWVAPSVDVFMPTAASGKQLSLSSPDAPTFEPIAATSASVALQDVLYLTKGDDLDLSNKIDFRGSATIELVYL